MLREALTVLALAFQFGPTSPREELKLLQGTWDMVSGERAGETVPDAIASKTRLVLTDRRQYTLTAGSEVESGIFLFDQRKRPRQIEFSPSEGSSRGMKLFGIYKLEGDTLTVCFAGPGKPRPTEFTTKSGSGQVLYVMKRMKA